MATRRKTTTEPKTPEAPSFTKAQRLTFDRYRGRRDLLGALLEDEQRYTYDEVDALMNDFMKGEVS